MIRLKLIAGLIAAAVPVALFAQQSGSQPDEFDLAKKKVIDCAGEKFVFSWGAGAKPTKVTLCSKENATPQELVVMLEDAAEKLQSTSSIEEDRRNAIVQQIRAKIAEVKSRGVPAARPLASARIAPSRSDPVVAAPAEIAALPPLPAPVKREAVPASATPVLLPRPKLSFECITPGEFAGGGPCVTLTRDTIVIVKSGDALAGGAAIRFIRKGEERGEVALGAMRKGQSRRLKLPARVCSGVYTSEVNFDIVTSGRVVDSIGPFLLRC